ncbi:MAG: hypothetical protein IJS40_09425 [Synergistaceae bacterium]|nr:hypothetical protein [Synergistaceae bacterium]
MFIAMLFFISENPGFAHGVGYREISLKAVPLEFFYSTGEKMSYCETKIFSPSDSKFAAQSGRTDEQGRFSFIPDASGEWRAIVRDNEGHQCEAKINITEEFLKSENEIENVEQNHENDAPEGFELFIRALLGVSLIFNFALLIKSHAHK